jgi:NitT/TauT family transport system substrate-binding protein
LHESRDEELAMRSTMALIITMIAASVLACLATSAAAETLKVAVAQRGFWNSSFIEFALQQGFFKQEGLDIEILYAEGAPRP